jgi:hypothetical protein
VGCKVVDLGESIVTESIIIARFTGEVITVTQVGSSMDVSSAASSRLKVARVSPDSISLSAILKIRLANESDYLHEGILRKVGGLG